MIHTNTEILFGKDINDELDKLWKNGDFAKLLENLGKLYWEELAETMIIYYSAKLRNLNEE